MSQLRKTLSARMKDLRAYRESDLYALMVEVLDLQVQIYGEDWTELTKERFDERKGAAKQIQQLRSSLLRDGELPII